MNPIVLRYYQNEGIQAVLDSFQESRENIPVVALETGTGKSLTIAGLCDVMVRYWDANVLVLGPNKEILLQNEKALHNYFPKHKVGVYSASLNRKERNKITLAMIGSVHKKATLFQKINVVIIDECHLINHKKAGMYRNFLDLMPQARIAGYSATIYRLGHGYIHQGEEALFNDLVLDYTSMKHFNRLVEDGYLAKMLAKPPEIIMDTSDLKTRMGDFIEKEMSEKFDKEQLNNLIVSDLIVKGAGYKKWLIFCIDIAHADHINEILVEKGIVSKVVHSKMKGDRTEIVEEYKRGELRCLVNVNTLTTGLDVPDIDLIGMLRPTKSPVLYKQIAGRGLRPWEGKDHCLFLDYAGVVPLLGPINDIKITQKRKSKPGDPIVKTCPKCEIYLPGAVRICPECGHIFEFEVHLNRQVGQSPIVVEDRLSWQNVAKVSYEVKNNTFNNKPPYLAVHYSCGLRRVTEVVCLDHGGTVSRMAKVWVQKRWSVQYTENPPETVHSTFEQSALLKRPTRIRINDSGKYPQVVGYDFKPIQATYPTLRK